MKAILHIGVENTGTTYLQHAFALNREALKQGGFLYPVSPGEENHIALTAFSIDPEKNDSTLAMAGVDGDIATYRWNLRRKMREEIDASGCGAILLSNEHCSSRLQSSEEIERLHSLITHIADECQVIVYLRRQDEAHLSLYSTSIRGGWTKPIAKPTVKELERRYDYDALLTRWGNVFGRGAVTPRLYLSSGLLDDFRTATGLPEITAPPERLNQRMTAAKISFLEQMNSRVSPNDLGDIAYLTSRLPIGGQGLALPAGMPEAIMAEVEASNRRVASEYFEVQPEGDPLFGPKATQDPTENGEMTMNEVLDIAASLWTTKNTQSRHLWEHIQQLTAGKGEAQ